MAIKICDKGHVTGTNECRCGANARTIKGPSGIAPRLSKRHKRAITQMLWDLGHTPVADL